MLYRLLRQTDPSAAKAYLERGYKLIEDVLALCEAPKASIRSDGSVDFGKDGWETILMVREVPSGTFPQRLLTFFSLLRRERTLQSTAILTLYAGSWTTASSVSRRFHLYMISTDQRQGAARTDADYYLLEFGNEALKISQGHYGF
jgi:hypothetical protein